MQTIYMDGIDTSLIDKKNNKFIKLIKNYDKESNEGYILEVGILKNYMICIVIYHFYQNK